MSRFKKQKNTTEDVVKTGTETPEDICFFESVNPGDTIYENDMPKWLSPKDLKPIPIKVIGKGIGLDDNALLHYLVIERSGSRSLRFSTEFNNLVRTKEEAVLIYKKRLEQLKEQELLEAKAKIVKEYDNYFAALDKFLIKEAD